MGEGLSATLRLEVMGEEQVDIATRAVSEGVVSNLHILVYNSSGELIGQKIPDGQLYGYREHAQRYRVYHLCHCQYGQSRFVSRDMPYIRSLI